MTSILRALPAAVAIAAASFAMGANAQGDINPEPPTHTRANPAPTPEVVQKVENSRAGRATERGVKKATHATKRAGHKTANAIRRTGNKIASKLPADHGTHHANESPETANVAPR
jgi:hypothetical protein